MEAYDHSLNPDWRETILRFTKERMLAHEHPQAVAQAIRQVSRDLPFDGIGALGAIDVPTLVIASNDAADPGHPSEVAEAWAEAITGAKLIDEDPGEAPLVWRGGLLSRAIAEFLKPALAA